MPILEAINIGRRHPNAEGWLLEDVSLAIDPGERIALVGPSGGGKTLLMRALAMLDPIDAGEIRWRGETVQGSLVPTLRAECLYLHQTPALADDTVSDILKAPFKYRSQKTKSYDESQIISWLKSLGRTESFLSQAARDLSGGERQLVALLRGLQLEPCLLLLDEPTSALDEATSLAVEQLLLDWQSEKERAFIWISHQPEQATRVAERQVRMKNGRVA